MNVRGFIKVIGSHVQRAFQQQKHLIPAAASRQCLFLLPLAVRRFGVRRIGLKCRLQASRDNMAQHKFKIDQVNGALMGALQQDEPTAFFAAISFQFGLAIGELIGMGVTPAQVKSACDEFVEKAVKTRAVSVNTKEASA
jgi:hypothetical protein